jgi:TatD DNase family protein
MQEVFEAQLAFARRRAVPAIIHTRDADDETHAVLAAHGGEQVVMHCFNGSGKLLELALLRGWYVSFAGNLTFPRAAELREAALAVPLERLLVETDAPFLAPQPVRGKRCEPAHVRHTADFLAALRGLSPAEMSALLTRNAEQCFGVSWG